MRPVSTFHYHLAGPARLLAGGWRWWGLPLVGLALIVLGPWCLAVLSDIGNILASVVAGTLNLRAWRAHPTNRLRPAWLLTGLSMGVLSLFLTLNRANYFDQEALRTSAPVLLLLSFACLLAGLGMRLRQVAGQGLRLAATLDALTITLAAAALELWLFWPGLPTDMLGTSQFWLGPLVAHIMALIVLYVAYQSSGEQRWLMIAMIFWAGFSIAASWLSALGGFGVLPVPQVAINFLGSLAMLANGWVAHIEHRTGGLATAAPTPSRLVLPVQLLPYGLIGAGTLLMMVHAAEIVSLPMLIVGLCMLLVLVRQWVVLRENMRLMGELRASHAIIARARDQAAQEARTDSLTGLPNRRFLDEHLIPLLAYHRRRHLPLSALFLDIDLFKAVNDRLGHAAGDQALITIGQCLTEAVREGDILARYGGEEFVILLPDTAEPEALGVAERLRRAVAARPLLIGGDGPTTLTVSLGVATYPLHGDTIEALLRAADAALYEAKTAGRNRVATPAVSLVRAGALAETA